MKYQIIINIIVLVQFIAWDNEYSHLEIKGGGETHSEQIMGGGET